MSQIIGFTTKFYTLWDYRTETQYVTDSYGNHHPSGVKHIYSYIKNISTSLKKVKSLFPKLPIDMSLRGSFSFHKMEKLDLPVGYFWFGKYKGKSINDILASDIKYCAWIVDNQRGPAADYIASHETYVAYTNKLKSKDQSLIDDSPVLKVGDVIEIEFTRNGYNSNDEYTECWTKGDYCNISLTIKCKGVRPVNGIYPYLMPIINGKAQKTKGKKIVVTVTAAEKPSINKYYSGVLEQIIEIA